MLTFTQPAVVHAYVFADVFVLPVPNGPALRLILFLEDIVYLTSTPPFKPRVNLKKTSGSPCYAALHSKELEAGFKLT